MPSSLKEIGCEAFRWCRNLNEIALPEGLEIIGVGCFRDTVIKEITIPKSVKSIGMAAFSGYRKGKNHNHTLEKITLKEGLEEIGVDCFICSAITEIVIPKSVKSIG